MRQRDVRQLIQDIQICILDIEDLTWEIDFQEYAETKHIRLAVERQFITIGEAIARMKRVSEETKNRIEAAAKISGFRNFLVHEYEAIDDEQVWNIVRVSMPMLKQQIDAWADELGMEPPPGQTR